MGERGYVVNDCFLTLQGEGVRAGTANVFLRFARCNLKCAGEQVGEAFQPICDTEFESGKRLSLQEVVQLVQAESGECRWIVLTGGEPALQVDAELIAALHAAGFSLAIETNGTIELPEGIDWITVSPKVAEHNLKQLHANEVKYVRGARQQIPRTIVTAEHYLLSPHFLPDGSIDVAALANCVELIKANPLWRLSTQQHKAWAIP